MSVWSWLRFFALICCLVNGWSARIIFAIWSRCCNCRSVIKSLIFLNFSNSNLLFLLFYHLGYNPADDDYWANYAHIVLILQYTVCNPTTASILIVYSTILYPNVFFGSNNARMTTLAVRIIPQIISFLFIIIWIFLLQAFCGKEEYHRFLSWPFSSDLPASLPSSSFYP